MLSGDRSNDDVSTSLETPAPAGCVIQARRAVHCLNVGVPAAVCDQRILPQRHVQIRRAGMRAQCVTERPSTAELRLFPAVRWSIREHGGHPSSRQIDQILDERAGDARGMPAIDS